MSATSDLNKANVVKFFDQVFNHGNMDIVDALISPSYQFNGVPTTAAMTKAWATGLRTQFPDLHFSVETILAEDDKVALRWRMTCTQAGKPVYNLGTNILVLVGGQAISNDQGGGDAFHPA